MSEVRATLDAMQRTPWYPADVYPVRAGLYERDHLHSRFGSGTHRIRYSYWNPNWGWGGWAVTKEGAYENRKNASWEQSIPWRGLARKP